MSVTKRWKEHEGDLILVKDEYETINCKKCQFIHVIPIPDDNELEITYSHEYYSTEKPDYLEKHQKDEKWWNLVYKERLDLLNRFLIGSERRLLDIGSGPGFFIKSALENGWDAMGIEPSEQAYEFSVNMGLNVINAFLTRTNSGDFGKFDVIHMQHVLEHMQSPIDFIEIMKDMLNDNGLLLIIVPNDFNPIQNALKESLDFEPWWVAPPFHLNYFTFDSLGKVIEDSGLEILYQGTTFPIDLFLLMGDNYIGKDDIGRASHKRRMNLELNLEKAGLSELKENLYQNFAKLGLGREVVLIGRIKK